MVVMPFSQIVEMRRRCQDLIGKEEIRLLWVFRCFLQNHV
jgi:hypothetical protein